LFVKDEKQPYKEKAKQIKDIFKAENPGHVFTRKSKNASPSKRKGHDSGENDQLVGKGTGKVKDPRGRKKRLKDPLAPKHPMSGFLFYLSSQRAQVTKANPGERVGPISKMIASVWRTLTAEERAPYEELARQDKERYKREMEAYSRVDVNKASPHASNTLLAESTSTSTSAGGEATPEEFLQDRQRALANLAEAAASTALAELESVKSESSSEPDTEEDELDGEIDTESSTPEDSQVHTPN
jgi:hypothetical protein